MNYDLVVTADYANRSADFRLLDEHGVQAAYRSTDFGTIPVGRQKGLFDLRNYVRHYVGAGRETASVAEIGVCIAEEVLGREIFDRLYESEAHRTLRVQLPGATEEENHLAAALARVPWELARGAVDHPTLAERNLLVRVVHDVETPATLPLGLTDGECLRILFVFAEAPGSRPLAARLERQRLRRLFKREIYPRRRVVADFLSHGVTRERLEDLIDDRGGYHIIHWSGHGHLNLLELARAGASRDRSSGAEPLDLCGGFIPRLMFLSACHSGDILRVRDWNEFLAIAEGGNGSDAEPEDDGAPERKALLEEQPGYTGTAHALLRRGVPSVVAMRYAVGDDYARELGVEFYRALLAHKQPKSAAASLMMARQSLLDDGKHDPATYSVCDHATPVLYGAEHPGIELPEGRSPALDDRVRRLHQIGELTASNHEHFVGRTWQLAELGSDFIGSRRGEETTPVAVITGLGGMGKTALTAEALSLWDSRFGWLFMYQAKPTPLGFDATFRDIHMKLNAELGRYHDHVQSHRADAIFRPPSAEFSGREREDRLTANLIRAMKDEAILLILDNFETNLKARPESPDESGEPRWASQDPAWDRCLARLADELKGSSSRVLITSRRPLVALDDTRAHRVLLGPLPAGEAALYLRSHAGLRGLVFGGGDEERALAKRLLEASRFHPLLMNRLARLATGGAELKPQLMTALTALENSQDYEQLPELFSVARGGERERELGYLNDALASSIDRLIQGASPDARRLLWTIALANAPTSFSLLKGVWSGESPDSQRLRLVKKMLESLPALPEELQEKLKAMPPEVRAAVEALPDVPAWPDPTPLLRHLVAVGLVTEMQGLGDRENSTLTCHELVRERVHAHMGEHPEDRGELTDNGIRLAYAQRLEAVFKALRDEDQTTALEAGSRALIYCVQAEAWDRLGGFASGLITSARSPRLLAQLIPHLEAAADAAPGAEHRSSCLTYLADALRFTGRPDDSLPLYEQAALQARATLEGASDEGARKTWAKLAWITGNWAIALNMLGDLDASRQRHLESADAEKRAGRPAIFVISSELEALRIDITRGDAEEAMPQVEAHLAQVQDWWERYQNGETVADAGDPEALARALIGALDIATQGDRGLRAWESALRRTDVILEIKRALGRSTEDIAGTRMNRASVLRRLRRLNEAQEELEACLSLFEHDDIARKMVLSNLSAVLADQGDIDQAITLSRRALALAQQYPDPESRSASHSNLANYLTARGTPSDVVAARRHRLADLTYCLLAGLGESLKSTLANYVVDFQRAGEPGARMEVPRLAELLSDPSFGPLDDWVRRSGVELEVLQTAVDSALDEAWSFATSQIERGSRPS